MSKWLKKGDRIVVVAGNEKGKTGKVLHRGKDRVVVEGVNMRKKHVKKSQENPQGQILTFEAGLHISNVRPCNEQGKPIRLKVRAEADKKELVYQDGGQSVVYRSISGAK